MKLIASILCLFGLLSPGVHGQEPELRWGEFGYYSNWDRQPYAIDSSYKYIGRLPDLREFPKLLKEASNPTMGRIDHKVVLSQMRTLSRCDFEKPVLYRGDDIEAEYRNAVSKWEDWWEFYGSTLAEGLEKNGERYEEAWQQVAPTPYLEVPKYPILMPRRWSTTISFRSGDYGGVTEEVIEFQVNEKACSLRRRYRTGWMGQEPWNHEEWGQFSRKEADHFLASLIYLIDNPWFYLRDEYSESRDEGDPHKIGHIRGRPEAWTDYYPSYSWTGIVDAERGVIINHDPWNWDTIDFVAGPETNLDGGFGVVFRLVRDLFPDPSWDSESSRWRRVEADGKEAAKQVDGVEPANHSESK